MFTDIHSHVIWGVDDGAETREETFRLLREAAEDGIGRIICTPHMTPGVYRFEEERFQEHLLEAGEYVRQEGLPLTLQRGAEILYTENTPRLLREGRLPTLAGTHLVLIEFSPTDTREHIFEAVQKVAGTGYIPLIAHLERYPAIHRTEEVQELKTRFHAKIQINARTLLRKQPLLRRGFMDQLFKRGLVDFVATDTHAMEGRGTCMTEGMAALKQKYGDIMEEQIRRKPDLFF